MLLPKLNMQTQSARVRATGRNCRQMRRKNIFGTKKFYLAKTSGEKIFSSEKIGILISPIWAILCHLIANEQAELPVSNQWLIN